MERIEQEVSRMKTIILKLQCVSLCIGEEYELWNWQKKAQSSELLN